jgi:hypothetical protein
MDNQERAKLLVRQHMSLYPKAWVMSWEGSKIPRGAKVGNIPIAWTQNSVVVDAEGTRLGHYERVEPGAFEKHNQGMIICTGEDVDSVTAPDGTECPLVKDESSTKVIITLLAKKDLIDTLMAKPDPEGDMSNLLEAAGISHSVITLKRDKDLFGDSLAVLDEKGHELLKFSHTHGETEADEA